MQYSLWLALFLATALMPVSLAAQPQARIVSIDHVEISPVGIKEARIAWETQNALNYLLRINVPCPPATGGASVQSGAQETTINANDLINGKNEIHLCLDVQGDRSELVATLYRNDTAPVVRAFPEPDEWNGEDPIMLSCTGCSALRYNLGSEQAYAGPISIAGDGARLSFFGLSTAGVKSELRTNNYERSESQKPWRSGRLVGSPLYLSVTGGMADVLSGGGGALVSYEQGPDALLNTARAWYIPGAKAELGVLYLTKQSAHETLLPLNVGPLWEIAPFRRHSGRFFFGGLLGVTLIAAGAGD